MSSQEAILPLDQGKLLSGISCDTAPTHQGSASRWRTEDVLADKTFSDIGLLPQMVSALAACGYERPSPVQQAAIPLGRLGSDLIVQAKSGTGKTVVFTTILLERLKLEENHVQAVVLAPTREIAIQIEQIITKVAAALDPPSSASASAAVSCGVFVGGLPVVQDEKRLRRLCHIAVGTPGRMTSLIESESLKCDRVTMFVLDEADVLLGDSFYADITWIYDQLPRKKQVMAYSATYTPELLADLEPLMKRPQRVMLCEETVSLKGVRQFYQLLGRASPAQPNDVNGIADTSASNNVNGAGTVVGLSDTAAGQGVLDKAVLEDLKVAALLKLLSSCSFHQAAVFSNNKPRAEWLARRLCAGGFPAVYLGGDLSQEDRQRLMEEVKAFKTRVVVSTDVLARGVDLDRINLVVNLDLPHDSATYVHRVGRTGRFGTRGVAVCMVTPDELVTLQVYLKEVAGGAVEPLPSGPLPPDLYVYELTSDWEKQALDELKQAPTQEPPPPPAAAATSTSKKAQHGMQDGEALVASDAAVAGLTAAAAAPGDSVCGNKHQMEKDDSHLGRNVQDDDMSQELRACAWKAYYQQQQDLYQQYMQLYNQQYSQRYGYPYSSQYQPQYSHYQNGWSGYRSPAAAPPPPPLQPQPAPSTATATLPHGGHGHTGVYDAWSAYSQLYGNTSSHYVHAATTQPATTQATTLASQGQAEVEECDHGVPGGNGVDGSNIQGDEGASTHLSDEDLDDHALNLLDKLVISEPGEVEEGFSKGNRPADLAKKSVGDDRENATAGRSGTRTKAGMEQQDGGEAQANSVREQEYAAWKAYYEWYYGCSPALEHQKQELRQGQQQQQHQESRMYEQAWAEYWRQNPGSASGPGALNSLPYQSHNYDYYSSHSYPHMQRHHAPHAPHGQTAWMPGYTAWQQSSHTASGPHSGLCMACQQDEYWKRYDQWLQQYTDWFHTYCNWQQKSTRMGGVSQGLVS